MRSYQEIFNDYLSKIRLVCNATNNKSLGTTIVKLMFDFSDELKDNDLIADDKQPENNY